MAQVPLQVAAAGSVTHEKAWMCEVRLSSTSVAVAASATDVSGTSVAMLPEDESYTYVLSHDATAGQITIELEHDDLIAGPYAKLTNDAVIYGGERKTVPVGQLVIDASDADNQGSIIVAVSPSARQLDANGNLIDDLKENFRLVYTTDGAWNGTAVEEIGLACHRHHIPGPDAD
jgi:hypothetical protein